MNVFSDAGRRQYSFFVRVEYARRVEGPQQIGTLPKTQGVSGRRVAQSQRSDGVKESPSGRDLAQRADYWGRDGSHEVEC